MAEKAVATESTIGRLSAAQTGKLGDFARGLRQSALEALGTTLDKKLEAADGAVATIAGSAAPGNFKGMYVTIGAELHLADGAVAPALLLIGEDEASALFNVSPDGVAEDEYKGKLEEAVQTTVTDLSDFLTLSVSVNS